jgi:hypothetical protein
VAIAVPAVIEDARRRQRLRRRGLGAFVLAAAVAVAATLGAGGLPGGGGSATVTFHSADGWTITYPSRFHRWAFGVGCGNAISCPEFEFSRGVSIGNFSPLPTDDVVPPTGVLFQLFTGNVDGLGAKNVQLPLTLRDFPLFAVDPAHVRQAGPGSYDFQIKGQSFHVVVVAGRITSRADLRALSQLVSSVRFPHARARG